MMRESLDFVLNLFLTTKTALYTHCLCLTTVPHSQIPGLHTEKSINLVLFCPTKWLPDLGHVIFL